MLNTFLKESNGDSISVVTILIKATYLGRDDNKLILGNDAWLQKLYYPLDVVMHLGFEIKEIRINHSLAISFEDNRLWNVNEFQKRIDALVLYIRNQIGIVAWIFDAKNYN